MVIHTFQLRFKPQVTPEQIDRALTEIRGFQGHVPGLLETHIGLNFSGRSRGFTFGAAMKFTDRIALETYDISPLHQQLLAWLVPLIEAAQDVDFEA